MARFLSLIAILSLCFAAAFAAPVVAAGPDAGVQHHAMNHQAKTGPHAGHGADNGPCGLCVLHCQAGDLSALLPLPRAAAFRSDAYLMPSERLPADAADEAPERPPKASLV